MPLCMKMKKKCSYFHLKPKKRVKPLWRYIRWKGAVQTVRAVFDTLLWWAFHLSFYSILGLCCGVFLVYLFVCVFVFRALWAGEGERTSFPQGITKLPLLQAKYFTWPTEMFLLYLDRCSIWCLKQGGVKILTYFSIPSVTFLMISNRVELFQYICALGGVLSFIPT